jgi:hypothetical protein
MSIAALVDRMVAAGMSAGEAGEIAAEIYAAGVASVPVDIRSPGAKRQAKWRLKTSQNVSGRLADETSQSVTKRLETSRSDALQNPPISTSKNFKSRERQNRGTQIAVDWSPSDAERSFAKQEGFSEFEIGREINKFRDYWTACAGAKGVKLDWSATWRQWIRSGAERAGKTPPPGSNAGASLPDSYYAKPDSAQLVAWDEYSKRTTGKTLARDRNGGWRVKAEWPPGHGMLPLQQPNDAYQEAGE